MDRPVKPGDDGRVWPNGQQTTPEVVVRAGGPLGPTERDGVPAASAA